MTGTFHSNRQRRWMQTMGVIIMCLLSLYSVGIIRSGSADFLVTTTVYLWILTLVTLAAFGYRTVRGPLLTAFVLTAGLYSIEVVLRFVTRANMTYCEQLDMGYVSMYRHGPVTDPDWNASVPGVRRHEPYEKRRNCSPDFCYPEFRCNRLGLRGDLPDDGSRVVAFLGDSFTFGVGTPCDSTIPAIVGHLLSRGGQRVHTINAGVAASDPFFDWNMLRFIDSVFTVSTAIMVMNTTDLSDVQARGGMERFGPDGSVAFKEGPWWEPVYATSFIFRALIHGPLGYGWNLRSPNENTVTHLAATESIVTLMRDRVAPYCRERGIRLFVVVHPLAHELHGEEDYLRFVSGLSAVVGLEVTDVRSHLSGYPAEQLYWPLDAHFTPMGYQLVAETVHGQLTGQLRSAP